MTAATLTSNRTNPAEANSDDCVQPEARSRYPRPPPSPSQENARANGSIAQDFVRRGGVDLQPSLFSRVAATEAELRAVEDILADVLDILAQVKAKQDEIRQDPDAQSGQAERPVTAQRRPWRRLKKAMSRFRRARFPRQPDIKVMSALLRKKQMSELDETQKDEFAFWRIIGKIAITSLFLMSVFMIGLYRLINHN